MKKILILKMEHIGDYILTLPSLRAIRRKYPKAKIDILIGPWNLELAEATSYIDDIIVFDNPLIKRGISRMEIIREITFGLPKYLRLFKDLNRREYDMLINFSDRKSSRFFNSRIRAKEKISGLDFDFGEINEGERMLRLIGGQSSDKAKLDISPSQKKDANNFLLKNKISKFIIIHPLTPIKEKNWPLEKWGKLSKRISGKIIFVGSTSDSYTINWLIKNFDLKNAYNASGKFDLIETYYLIKKSHLFLGQDSGPMHLANFAGTKSIVLFGNTNERVWGSSDKRNKVIKCENLNNISENEVLQYIK